MSQLKGAKNKQMITSNGGINPPVVAGDLSSSAYSLPFFYYMTIPRNTTKSLPLVYNMSLPIGFIQRVWVEFPKGCGGLVGVNLYRGVTQIFPLPAGTFLVSDDAILNFAFSHDMSTEPYNIIINGYNLDDTYNHTIWVGVEMRGLYSDITPQIQSFIDSLKG